jgi:hypothetical protein
MKRRKGKMTCEKKVDPVGGIFFKSFSNVHNPHEGTNSVLGFLRIPIMKHGNGHRDGPGLLKRLSTTSLFPSEDGSLFHVNQA